MCVYVIYINIYINTLIIEIFYFFFLISFFFVDKKYSLKLKTYPRWYQDFSPDQIKNLMKLENVMHIDYEETKTHGTQTTLIAIGVISTFFQLKPSTIKELHKLCNLNSVDFLRKIYRILTGNDFCEEGYKKVYNCNERIILSAIAFLTLPETVKELHKRLPAVTVPKLPPKPKLITCMPRRKNICPYKEELFTRPDWASYRNALQKWRKHCKLIAIPKVILPLNEYYGQSFINKKLEITKGERDITTEHFDKINIKELQKVSSTMYDQKDFKDADSSRERNLNSEELATSNIFGLPDNGKKFDFIRNLDEKPEIAEYKICDLSKPLEEIQKSWLEKKDPVTYEMEVANVTPSNSDERFFAVLKLGDRTKKVFPSGRENLSINWQEWLQHVDENYWQLEEKTDELIKSVQTIFKSTFPESVCDSCCLCRQIKKLEKLQQNKIDKTLISEEKNTDLMAMQSSEQNQAGSLINQVASEDKIKTNIIINEVTTEAEQIQNHIMGIQEDKIHVLQKFEPPASSISVRNIPSCLCAIQQMTDKGISLSVSKEDIPWTKEEGLCPGRKYRPNEAGAYSCKTYPGDKFCRHNPFIKEMMKMEREKIEKLEELKEKTEFIEAVKKETLVPKKNIFEKKTVKFNFDSDYPVYDDSWNISRTAPSKVTKTDYETPLKLTSSTYKIVMQSLNKENSNKIEKDKEIDKVVREKNEYSEETVDKIDHQQNISHKQVIDKTEEKIDERSHRINDDKKYINNNSDLIAIVKAELQKMAVEGYIFAKLPKCYLMPQLQDWIMYREGVAFSETDKKNLMQATRAVWDLINLHIPREIEKPSLHMTKPQLKRLTYDQVERMKKKIGKVKAIFHSKVRKARVSYCRMMWKTMEYGKFPSASFKRTFFTYMASKEADGHVYKPWLPSEIHQRDFSFCC
ncbi:uncharacterized protein LOC105835391 isoform X2 [Monomorium pharaonis]|uniref:uncharacterized protein LOC105835391 isoform X2 n=2 Tax=Monomorium pharaonis TaxID=307658 RepID=UPI001747097A|nr:uncharacterized protein LOC105835391 isoform X2 [Monomorium pharaonis]